MTHELITKLTEMLEIQQKLHETAIDMIKPAIEAEREACAKVCEELERKATKQTTMVGQGCQACAVAIRARGQA